MSKTKEWSEEEFIESTLRFIRKRRFSTEGLRGWLTKLIGNKQFREAVLQEKTTIVKREIELLVEMREWREEEFK